MPKFSLSNEKAIASFYVSCHHFSQRVRSSFLEIVKVGPKYAKQKAAAISDCFDMSFIMVKNLGNKL